MKGLSPCAHTDSITTAGWTVCSYTTSPSPHPNAETSRSAGRPPSSSHCGRSPWEGEATLIGFLSEDNPGIDYFLLKGSDATTRSITAGDRTQLHSLVRAVTTTGLTPVIDEIFAFPDARAAFERLRDGKHLGKLVIRVN
ncbi:zinc-binding dehydrogenase [Mycobacterium sp. 1482292.6]|uniref:zinc-binding dehydrogenase n=1 Tax=Mycobacterium sp. 1482292.6 TaxID=1834081 RepID=UPI0009F66146|nr:zinc-binding dehydrogenase [Mycobacterium sp. 1482292.6]